MTKQHKNSLLTAIMQSEVKMSRRLILYGIIVICFTILVFTWMVRGSLCELNIKQGNTEFSAVLAYEAKR
ncbi:Hok/gef family protein [Candidatus Regiella insecticola 5.15]|uniref:Hok/gef family protein n=2 Tax=Candidatus Regiella insecticola TaxID=138073 RepID=G2H2C1_9ENTR|nr:Hok/gef family protein [Candidatus Regiella insecticola 5.15]